MRLFHALNHPIDRIVGHLHEKGIVKTKRVHKVVIGAVLMFAGSLIASAGHGLPEGLKTVADVTGYLIHGYGTLPIVKILKEHIFEIEGVPEEPKEDADQSCPECA